MTETSKAVVPTWQTRARLALREGAALKDVAKAIVAGVDEEHEKTLAAMEAAGVAPKKVAEPFPAVPKAADLTAAQKAALVDLSKVFNAVTPTERRLLTDDEHVALYKERETLREILDPLATRDEKIKEYVRNHMDVAAEQDGKADPIETPRDAKGHYIVAEPGKPERATIPGVGQDWSREFSSGTVTVSGGDLLDLYEKGEITREVYLSFTRETRVFDEVKATAAIVKDPSLLSVLKKITKRSRAGTALNTRKTK